MSGSRPDDRPARRLRVTMNMAMSLDGKITTIDGGMTYFGGAEDLDLVDQLRAEADAVLIGAGTLRAEGLPTRVHAPERQRQRTLAKGAPHPRNLVVYSQLPEDPGALPYFHSSETEKTVFTTDRSTPEQRAAVARFARVEVVAADPEGRVDLAEVIDRLPALGIGHLLLEGGGELNFSMLQADLIDEIYLTICPLVFGGRTAPTVIDGVGLTKEQVRTLTLQDCRVGSTGEVFLRYTRNR